MIKLINYFKTRNNPDVYLHIEKLIEPLPLYHIGMKFQYKRKSVRYDFGHSKNPIKLINTKSDKINHTIYLDKSKKTIDEVIEYEYKINRNYILGLNDCRHYTRNLAEWTTGIDTPIWNINRYL